MSGHQPSARDLLRLAREQKKRQQQIQQKQKRRRSITSDTEQTAKRVSQMHIAQPNDTVEAQYTESMAGPQTSKRLKLEEEDNKQAPNVLVAYGSDSDQDELADKKVLNKEHTNVVDKNVKPDFSKIEEEEQDIERLIGSIGNETAASTDTLLREMEEFERDISGLDSKNNEKASLNTDGVSESPAVQTFDGSKNSDSGVVVVVDPYSEKGLEMQGEVLQQHIAQLQQVRDLLCQDEDADGVDGAMDVAEGSNPDRSASNSGDDDSDDDDGQEYAEFMTDWRRGML